MFHITGNNIEFWVKQVTALLKDGYLDDLHSFLLFTLKEQASIALINFLSQQGRNFIKVEDWTDF